MVCGQAGVIEWTISGGGSSGAAALCVTHSLPLKEALEAAAVAPQAVAHPAWKASGELPRRTTRRPRIQTLDWTPPDS